MKNDAIVAFVKKWLLCFAMTAGVCGYFLLDSYVHQEQNRRLIVEGVTGILPFLQIGETSHDRISGGQSLGQKNTILAIWIGTTYLNPTSGIIMGAYMLWQNVCNALQLSYKRLR